MDLFAEKVVLGVSLGVVYALIALGYVIIFKATGVINFAHGALMTLGIYLMWQFVVEWDLPYYLSAAFVIVLMAVFGGLVDRTVTGRMIGKPVFAIVMVTLGLEVVIRTAVQGIWGPSEKTIPSPWGFETVEVFGITILESQIAVIVAGSLVVLAFFLFFRYSRTGLGMRAAAIDQEAALAVGISVRNVFTMSWAIAGALAAIAGIFVATTAIGGDQFSPNVGFIALLAFPAAIVGGLDSPGGAIVGGIIIGLVQSFTGAYLVGEPWEDLIGRNFQFVAPYLVMVLVLLIRPYGLFGTKEIERV